MSIPSPFTDLQLALLQRGEATPDLQQEVAQRIRVLLTHLAQYEVRGQMLEQLLTGIQSGVVMHPNTTSTGMVDQQGRVWVLSEYQPTS